VNTFVDDDGTTMDGSTMDRSGRSIDRSIDPNPSVSTTRHDTMHDETTRDDARSTRLCLSRTRSTPTASATETRSIAREHAWAREHEIRAYRRSMRRRI